MGHQIGGSIQAQVVKVGVGTQVPRRLDRVDPGDPTLLLDSDNGRRFRIKYELVDNSFSEGGKLVYWKAPSTCIATETHRSGR
jgi:hypothetical protein